MRHLCAGGVNHARFRALLPKRKRLAARYIDPQARRPYALHADLFDPFQLFHARAHFFRRRREQGMPVRRQHGGAHLIGALAGYSAHHN